MCVHHSMPGYGELGGGEEEPDAYLFGDFTAATRVLKTLFLAALAVADDA